MIDDRPETIDLMTYVLGKAGLTVVMARSLDEALRLALTNPPDLIVCDIHFNGEDGFQFAARLQAEVTLRDIPRVLFTERNLEPADHRRAQQAGYIAAVRKPLRESEWPDLFKSFIKW